MAATESAPARIDAYLQHVTATLHPRAHEALRRVDEMSRRWLAVRAYLRAGDRLAARWTWSAAQIAAYTDSAEHRQLLEAIAAVRARFEAQNPGYSLYANLQTRSLDLQLERWNANPAVGLVAQDLRRDVETELTQAGYPAQPDRAAVSRLAAFLRAWRPPQAAPLAAPGLSLHGQLRAIDFQVMRGEQIVAPTEIAQVEALWERQGWARKLRLATAQSGFVGPLRSPNEPWHYEYMPVTPRAAAPAEALHRLFP